MTAENRLNTGRKLYIDVLRILAAFFVVYNHTYGYHQYLYEYAGIRKTGIFIAFSSLTKINVPIFYMISGALLLGKEESYTSLFSKRILRFFTVLLCASSLAYVFLNDDPLSFGDFITKFITGNVKTEYWFLYSYLGLLFMLPFLRKVAQNISLSDMRLLLGGMLLVKIVPAVSILACQYLFDFALPKISSKFSLPFIDSNILFYPLVGFYFEKYVPAEKLKGWLPHLLGASLAGILISTMATICQGVTDAFTQDHIELCVRVYAPAVFLMVKYFVFKVEAHGISPRISRVIHTFGTLTLGVYLMDPFFRPLFFWPVYNLIAAPVHPFPYSLIYCVISILCCSAVTYVLKKIPVVGKIL